ncbi:hypothetical protein PPACK8108_LOCUS25386 [Phakopsora pachyrhizi]|uniref:Uncharacterized protein n=1 Tax=Phakopsora pachyrhizi TaxID=170000 RepID=A0AAV0BV91_PHAPC|nr:hypothetical protein PPACK8108_LOCUS25386 [Phakopsora pachyrhizi]
MTKALAWSQITVGWSNCFESHIISALKAFCINGLDPVVVKKHLGSKSRQKHSNQSLNLKPSAKPKPYGMAGFVHLFGIAKGIVQGSEILLVRKTNEVPKTGITSNYKHPLDFGLGFPKLNEARLDEFDNHLISINLDDTLNQSSHLNPITPLVFDKPSTLNHNWNIKSFGDSGLGDSSSINGSLCNDLGAENLNAKMIGVSDYKSPQNSIYRLGIGNIQANKKRLLSDSTIEKSAVYGAFPTYKKLRSCDVLPGHLLTSGTNDQVHQAFDLVHQESDLYQQLYQSPFHVNSDQRGSAGSQLKITGYAVADLHPTMNHEESFAYSPLTENASNEFPASTIKFEKELPYTQGKIETCIGPFSEAESWLSNFPSPFHDSDTAPNQLPGSTIQLSAKNKNGLYSDAETWLANFPSPFQDSDTLPPQRPESHNPVNAKNHDEPYSGAESWLSNFPSPFHDSDTFLNQRPVYSTEVDVNNNEPLSRAKSWLSNFPSPFHESDTLPNQCPKSHTQVNAKSNNGPIAEAENLLSNIPSPVNDFGTFLNQLSNYQAHPTNYPACTALPTTQIEIPGSLKRLKSLGLENKLNFIEELKEKFDGKMKKTIDVDIDWCESACKSLFF